MPERERTESAGSSPRSEAKSARKAAAAGGARGLAARADRAVKDVDRLLRSSPETSPYDRAMAQLEQAKILALLELAEAIRANGKAASPPK
jgi:hypothetical protein